MFFNLASAYASFDPMNLIIEPSDDVGGVYLGNYEAASNTTLLRKHKINAVLTVAAGTGLHYSNSSIANHEVIPAMDVEYYDLSKHFEQCFDFIEKARKNTNVLIHCWAGVSRSATIVIMYLMRKYEFSLDEAHSFVKKKRRQIYPNPGFLRQLKNFEATLRSKRRVLEPKIVPQNSSDRKATPSSNKVERTIERSVERSTRVGASSAAWPKSYTLSVDKRVPEKAKNTNVFSNSTLNKESFNNYSRLASDFIFF